MVNGAMGLLLYSNFAESSASVVLRVGREESPKPSSRPAAANGSSGGAGASTLGGSGSATGGTDTLPFVVDSSINGVGASMSTDELIAAGSDTPEESKPSKSISGAGAAGGGGAAGANEVVGCGACDGTEGGCG